MQPKTCCSRPRATISCAAAAPTTAWAGGDGNDTIDGTDPVGGATDPFGLSTTDWAIYQLQQGDSFVGGVVANIGTTSYTYTANGGGTIAGGTARDPSRTVGAPVTTDTLIDIEAVTGTHQNDVLIGGNAANDELEVFEGLAGDDFIDGRSGFDVVDYAFSTQYGASNGARVNLSLTSGVLDGITVGAMSAFDPWGGVDTLVSIEGVRGSALGDVLLGGALDEGFSGLAGADVINGGAGMGNRVSYVYDANGAA